MKNKNLDLVHGPISSTVLRYALPMVATNLLSLLFNAADLVVVGRFCGKACVAAVGSNSALINLILSLFTGLSVGAGITLAHATGAGDEKSIHDTIHTAISVSLVGGVFVSVFGILMSRRILLWMGTPEDVLPLSTLYLRLYFSGAVAMLFFNFSAALLRAIGDTYHPMIYLTSAGALNFGLNVFFVLVFDMNVAGVGLATALSQVLAAGLSLRLLLKKRDVFRLRLRDLRINRHILSKMMQIGIPSGMRSCLFALSNVTIQSSINSFGSTVMAGNAAAGNLEGFVYMAMYSFAMTSMNFAGQCLGAKRIPRIRKVLRACILFGCGVGILMGVSFWLLATPLLSIYVPGEPEAIAAGTLRLLLLCVPYFTCCVMDCVTYTSSGIEKVIIPTTISLVGACGLRIIFIYTLFRLPFFHTYPILLSTYLVSWIITGTAQYVYFRVQYKKLLKRYPPQQLSPNEAAG